MKNALERDACFVNLMTCFLSHARKDYDYVPVTPFFLGKLSIYLKGVFVAESLPHWLKLSLGLNGGGGGGGRNYFPLLGVPRFSM